MATAPQLVRYFRDCYEADNRETGIANLFAPKYRHVHFLSGTDDLLCGLFDRVPIDREKGLAARKDAELYRKDRTLVYAAFPLVGAVPADGRLPGRLCAPLLFFPARIAEHDSVAFLEVDFAQQRVNTPVLAALAGGAETASSLVEELLGQIPRAPFRRDDVHSLISLLIDFLPGIEAFGLAEYPKLCSEEQVRRAMKRLGDEAPPLQCLPACATALIPNSPNTRGVLFELAELADGRAISRPARLILGESAGASTPAAPATGRVPAVLSHAQQRVLASAFSEPLTLVVGPPGTGKSYTIAALALDHLSRGESVLVASRMNHAVDVVARKIEEMIGPTRCVIRGGRSQYLRDLKKSLGEILHGIGLDESVDRRGIRRAERELAALDRAIRKIERNMALHGESEKQWGMHTAGPADDGPWSKVLRPWKLRMLHWRLGARDPLWESARRYESALEQRSRLVRELLQAVVAHRIESMLRRHRSELNKFLQAIRARTDLKQEQLFSRISLDVLLGTFPIWLVNMADISEVLPLQSEIFDLVIIDEATQCDTASCLPVLQRARRAVIVGDPNQLRHVSFLSRDRQRAIAEQNELDDGQRERFEYRDKSVLDLLSDTIATQRQVVFLDEHFRSMPPIIAFSNREFYAGALRVMTERPETVDRECVRPCRVAEGRKERGMNRREAEAIVDQVVGRIERERPLSAEVCHSLGVLSPFRDQVDHIAAMLQNRVSVEAMTRHQLTVGTAHAFQGEERDVMFLSLVVDAESHPASFQFLNNPNVFNVAITRARSEQYVYFSLDPEEAPAETLLQRYLSAITDGSASLGAPRELPPDRFLQAVEAELRREGFETWPAYPVAGMSVDLMIARNGKTLGIDLVGHPGEFASLFDLERYRMLQRAGLALFPLPFRAWSEDKEACLASIRGRLY